MRTTLITVGDAIRSKSLLSDRLDEVGITFDGVFPCDEQYGSLLLAVDEHFSKCDTLLIAGGISPSGHARKVVSELFFLPLRPSKRAAEHIARFCAMSNPPIEPEDYAQCALLPSGAKSLVGDALIPGCVCKIGNKLIILLNETPDETALHTLLGLLQLAQPQDIPISSHAKKAVRSGHSNRKPKPRATKPTGNILALPAFKLRAMTLLLAIGFVFAATLAIIFSGNSTPTGIPVTSSKSELASSSSQSVSAVEHSETLPYSEAPSSERPSSAPSSNPPSSSAAVKPPSSSAAVKPSSSSTAVKPSSSSAAVKPSSSVAPPSVPVPPSSVPAPSSTPPPLPPSSTPAITPPYSEENPYVEEEPPEEDPDYDNPDAQNEVLYYTSAYGSGSMNAYDLVCQAVQNETHGMLSPEALKAHVIATYTFIKYNNARNIEPNLGLDSQVSKAVSSAASKVFGQAIYYDGKLINAVYHSTCGGATTSAQAVWGGNLPYLVSVDSHWDEKAPGFATAVRISTDDFSSAAWRVYGIELSGSPEDWITVEHDAAGGYVGTVILGGKSTSQGGSYGRGNRITGRSIREQLMAFKLRSHNFNVRYDEGNDSFIFTVYGYGHGVGMSQYGSHFMALEGHSYKEILTHYYTGVVVK